LRGEILAAASKMFADRGYEAVTLRGIAKEIGYTHAVIYQHFPDKWHILAELSSETIGLMVQNFILVRNQIAVVQLLPACGEVVGRQIVSPSSRCSRPPPGES
jgi:AcrR family transcriptional regulator